MAAARPSCAADAQPLGARDIRMMVAQVAASKALSDDTVSAVVERTGGVPLFVEELTRAMLESGDVKLTGGAIPATLHDSLMARLDRLGPAKEVIQIGAVLGSEFSYELLHAVYPIAEAQLQQALERLADVELLYVRGLAPEATYQFKHALIRDAAYEALLKSRRKELHFIVARTIDEKFQGFKEMHPEVLARHWTEAGELEPAIAAWTTAAKSAQSRNAFQEGLESYNQAVVLIRQLPDCPERNKRELQSRQAILQLLQITKGWGSQEAVGATEQGAALAEKTGDIKQLAHWTGALSFSAWVRGDLITALTLADRTYEFRLRLGIPTGLAHAHLMEMNIRYWLYDLANAERFYVDGCAFFGDAAFANEPVGAVIAAFAYGAWTAWQLGKPDSARQRIKRMNAVTDELNPHKASFAAQHEAEFWAMVREPELAEEQIKRALEIARKHHFGSTEARLECLLGEVVNQLGHPAQSIELIRKGLSATDQVGATIGRNRFIAHLARAQAEAGYLNEALVTVEQALAMDPAIPGHRPEMLSIRGQIHLKLNSPDSAEADFRNSIALAQSMSAKSWELRSTMSFAQLLRDTGRRNEALTMLAKIYSWFTEGFDTPDLIDAKALLDELAG
jgi:tetratricopeptide (TPR) repeat protein